MEIYNTSSHRLEPLSLGSDVNIYVCGITPYDAAHMGHVFTFLTYDVLQRYLEHKGHHVKLVRNITDVDEPIYARAKELGIPYTQLAARETASFQQVMQQLNILEPFAEPRASEYIADMAAAVKTLLDTGHAYEMANGDILFDVSTFPGFGNQSGLSKRLQTAFMASRGGNPARPGKRNPLDFLLWKAVPDTSDPARWESVVGSGRPGWHIECSIMSSKLLGTPIDIHGGGMDLIFPHHECETAQSESLGAHPFVRHWVHTAPLYCHGEKMSKSLGNLVFAADLLKSYEPAAIRFALFNYHYRIGGEWQDELLVEADDKLAQIRKAIAGTTGPDPQPYLERFYDALEDDLDLPEAMHALTQLACHAPTHTSSRRAQPALKEMLDILGLSL